MSPYHRRYCTCFILLVVRRRRLDRVDRRMAPSRTSLAKRMA
jgi:hypothetical protein